jgi:hypothetical protein
LISSLTSVDDKFPFSLTFRSDRFSSVSLLD